MYTYNSYTDGNTIYVDVSYNGTLIGNRKFDTNYGEEAAIESLQFEAENFGFAFGGNSYPSETEAQAIEETITPAEINGPDVSSIQKTKDDLDEKIKSLQEIGLPGVKDVPKTLWKELIEPKLLTPRQVAKKILIIQGQAYPIPITEEDAQLIIYGKIYYKDGKLYDNDKKDPACVAQPGDEDYQPPLDENHPIWKNIKEMVTGLKDKLIQLGIKLGEFLFAIPQAIITIATSLIALVSSAIILPFGAGIPAALTAVMTMLSTIKELQAKTAALLPLIGVVDAIALLLPKEAQAIVAQVNVVYGILLGIITALTEILGLLGKVTGALEKGKKKMDEQKLKLEVKADPSTISNGETTKLSATATGGDWNYTYQWTTGRYSSILSKEQEIEVKPTTSTTYDCKVIDGTGTIKTASVNVVVTRF